MLSVEIFGCNFICHATPFFDTLSEAIIPIILLDQYRLTCTPLMKVIEMRIPPLFNIDVSVTEYGRLPQDRAESRNQFRSEEDCREAIYSHE